jgi:hypothetical protein
MSYTVSSLALECLLFLFHPSSRLRIIFETYYSVDLITVFDASFLNDVHSYLLPQTQYSRVPELIAQEVPGLNLFWYHLYVDIDVR